MRTRSRPVVRIEVWPDAIRQVGDFDGGVKASTEIMRRIGQLGMLWPTVTGHGNIIATKPMAMAAAAGR